MGSAIASFRFDLFWSLKQKLIFIAKSRVKRNDRIEMSSTIDDKSYRRSIIYDVVTLVKRHKICKYSFVC